MSLYIPRDGPTITLGRKRFASELLVQAARNGTLPFLLRQQGVLGGGSSAAPRRARSFNYSATSRYRRNRRRGPYQQLTSGSRHTNPLYPPPEVKFLDTALASFPISSTGGIGSFCFNAVAQGITGANRIGQQINCKSLSYHLNFDQATATPESANIRVIIFWDKQANGGTPTVAQLIQGTATINSFLNISNKERFVVLRNITVSLSVNGVNTDVREGHIKLNMLSTFVDATSNPRTGAIFAYYISDVAANFPTVNGTYRFRFTDC